MTQLFKRAKADHAIDLGTTVITNFSLLIRITCPTQHVFDFIIPEVVKEEYYS
jgi:hypothetical protein